MGHVGEEYTLLSSRLIGLEGFFFQFVLFVHEQGDVADESEVSGHLALFVIFWHTVDGIPVDFVVHDKEVHHRHDALVDLLFRFSP